MFFIDHFLSNNHGSANSGVVLTPVLPRPNVCRISTSLASVTYFELLATLSLLCLVLVCLINRRRLFASTPSIPKNNDY